LASLKADEGLRINVLPWSYLAPFRRSDSFYVILTPPLFHPNFGGACIPLHQIAHVGVSERMGLKLFGREIIFEEFQRM